MSFKLELLKQRIIELEAENAKLRQIIEENIKREAENTELKSKNDNTVNNNTPNNNTSFSNFNSDADHHEKSSQKKEMNNFLDEARKKSIGENIAFRAFSRQCNKEKKLKKAEQASLNQDQESGTFFSEKIPEITTLKIPPKNFW
ncbi:hypothetical protein RclHR1_03030001 [Rhizophagus clarus]|uniref:Uncharacterized protein n=1 Tax=Rhizophagus clarus TaxID=94130 RepID=A0A2Z6R5G8_9GLOM|nr:hypothetical protein RclHR1_03030001 [Rhizophagus clarus]